jgi:hypothetical protein
MEMNPSLENWIYALECLNPPLACFTPPLTENKYVRRDLAWRNRQLYACFMLMTGFSQRHPEEALEILPSLEYFEHNR